MQNYIVELVGDTQCSLDARVDGVIATAIREATGTCFARKAEGPVPAPARLKVTLECWRDANSKLHCRLAIERSQDAQA